jgi:hypothetical protein
MEALMKKYVSLILTLVLSLAFTLTGCAGAATSAGVTTQSPIGTTANGQTTAPPDSTMPSGGTGSTTTNPAVSSATALSIKDILSANEIGAILAVTPDKYSDDRVPTDTLKLATYEFPLSEPQGSYTYMKIGIIVDPNAVASGYRDPATPRFGSTISECAVLGGQAYLDTQTYDAIIDDKVQTLVNNYELVCIRSGIYYYLSTGYFPLDQVDHFRTSLPAILEKLIQNAEARLR